MSESTRFHVVYGYDRESLEEGLNSAAYKDYRIVAMTSGPWLDKSGPDNTLEQTGDSLYVLLERK
jgi:hypothetical protein